MKTIQRTGMLLALALLAGCQTAATRTSARTEESPHAQAIQIVMQTQAESIRRFDKENWWHDTKMREWSAQRPFAPGYIDSTHLFDVTYKIDGVVVSSWLVDTQKRSVQLKKDK